MTEIIREREFKGAMKILKGKARVLKKQGTKKTTAQRVPFLESRGNLTGPKPKSKFEELRCMSWHPIQSTFFPVAVSFVA